MMLLLLLLLLLRRERYHLRCCSPQSGHVGRGHRE